LTSQSESATAMSNRWQVGVTRTLALKLAFSALSNLFLNESLPLLAELRVWIHTHALACLQSRGCQFQSFQLGIAQLTISIFLLLSTSSTSSSSSLRIMALLSSALLLGAGPWAIWVGFGPMDRDHLWMDLPGDVPWAQLSVALNLVMSAMALGLVGIELNSKEFSNNNKEKENNQIDNGVENSTKPSAARSHSPARSKSKNQ
jgi:hypothetical protein